MLGLNQLRTCMNYTVAQWRSLFEQINADDPDNCVPLTDVDYYADQIQNLTSCVDGMMPRADAVAIAQQLAN